MCYNGYIRKAVIMLIKKNLIHSEYICILHIIALPFLLMMHQRGSMMIYACLIFLDAAVLLLQVDEEALIYSLMDTQLKTETQRIKIYLLGILIFYGYLMITGAYILLIILLINDAVCALLSILASRLLWKDEE
ncbi:MAG: hypothetical protein HFF01_06120 [Erysipelotrichaceae bacterium]|nr:hypothetical protein [Erysipelotrichaceae bacterium]MCI9524614.1 hypothetical protein [Erysipelotrichaceae bacterium]